MNVELFEKVEALGDLHEEGGPPMEWTAEALALLQDKLKQSPPIALDFVTDMLRRDTEVLAKAKKLTRIDASILSHADADHFNAVPGLLRSLPIDRVLMHRTFLDFDQPLVKRFGDELKERKVPVRLVEEGDRRGR